MNPYYQDDAVTIYHGDCREVLPTMASQSAALVLTDPPFGNGLDYGGSFEDTPQYLQSLIAECVPEMRRVADVSLLTCGPCNIHMYPAPRWVLAWFIPAGSGSTPWGFGTWQPVLAYGDDPYLKLGLGRKPDSITRGNQGARVALERDLYGHPCPKPLQAWKHILLRGSAKADDLIVDPFMGSGTTLRAAKDLGRHAIGVEIDERYWEAAARRMGQEVLAL